MGICCSKSIQQADKFYAEQDESELSAEKELTKVKVTNSRRTMARMAPAIVSPSAKHTATVSISYTVCLIFTCYALVLSIVLHVISSSEIIFQFS